MVHFDKLRLTELSKVNKVLLPWWQVAAPGPAPCAGTGIQRRAMPWNRVCDDPDRNTKLIQYHPSCSMISFHLQDGSSMMINS